MTKDGVDRLPVSGGRHTTGRVCSEVGPFEQPAGRVYFFWTSE